jgi:hypothetical protein
MGGRKRKSRKDCCIAKCKLSEGLIDGESCPREGDDLRVIQKSIMISECSTSKV